MLGGAGLCRLIRQQLGPLLERRGGTQPVAFKQASLLCSRLATSRSEPRSSKAWPCERHASGKLERHGQPGLRKYLVGESGLGPGNLAHPVCSQDPQKRSAAQVVTRSVVLPLAGRKKLQTKQPLPALNLGRPRPNLAEELLALHPKSLPDASQPKHSTNRDRQACTRAARAQTEHDHGSRAHQ